MPELGVGIVQDLCTQAGSRNVRLLLYDCTLCANMNETLIPKEFRVEGEEGVGDEFFTWRGGPGSGCERGRGDGQGNAVATYSASSRFVGRFPTLHLILRSR